MESNEVLLSRRWSVTSWWWGVCVGPLTQERLSHSRASRGSDTHASSVHRAKGMFSYNHTPACLLSMHSFRCHNSILAFKNFAHNYKNLKTFDKLCNDVCMCDHVLIVCVCCVLCAAHAPEQSIHLSTPANEQRQTHVLWPMTFYTDPDAMSLITIIWTAVFNKMNDLLIITNNILSVTS